MIVFPLKWLPYILAIGGFLWFFTEGEVTGLVMGLIGAVWIYYIQKGKSRPSTSPQTSSAGTSAYKAPSQIPVSTVNAVNTSNSTSAASPAYTTHAAVSKDPTVCPNCRTPIGEGMSFCTSCGTKVK